VRGLLTREEVREKSVAELDAILDDMFSFDNFAWQRDNGVVIDEPFRADGLNRILYRCAHCGAEGEMEGRGTLLTCHHCGKQYELDTLSNLTQTASGVVDRKLNVAITRARKQLFVLGNEKLLLNNALYAQLINYSREKHLS
jgi:DNA-directed RNA polymerase subunit RPC12/RpoP